MFMHQRRDFITYLNVNISNKYVDVISTFYIYWNMELLEDVIYSIMIFVLHEIARSVREYSRKQARHTV